MTHTFKVTVKEMVTYERELTLTDEQFLQFAREMHDDEDALSDSLKTRALTRRENYDIEAEISEASAQFLKDSEL